MQYTVGKLSTRVTTLLQISYLSKVYKKSYGPPKLRESETKCYLDVALVEKHIVYYKGEGGGFPQVWAMVSLVSPSLPVVRPSTKSAQTMH
jgi:hypothetical protein